MAAKKKQYTLVRYTSVTGHNYTKENACLLEGAVTPGQIKAILECLDEGKYFVPEQVGFPCVRVSNWNGDHKIFCILNESSFSPYVPDKSFSESIFTPTVVEVVKRFRDSKGKWNGNPQDYGIVPYGDAPCVLEQGQKHGYPYLVFYNGRHPCAYIGIPGDHPLYKKSEYKIGHLPCHGGVSYTAMHLPAGLELELNKKLYWIGWDYGYGNDLTISEATGKTVSPGRVWKISEIMEDVEAASMHLRVLHSQSQIA